MNSSHQGRGQAPSARRWWDGWWPEAVILLCALLLRLPIPGPAWMHIDERAFIQVREYGDAIATLRKRLDLQPDADTYTNLAAAYQLSGQPELAKRSLRLALELFPDHAKAKQALESVGAKL